MVVKKVSKKKAVDKKKTVKKVSTKDFPTLKLKTEHDIAMDFAIKASQVYNKMVKSIVLFGSTVKKEKVAGSDIDILIILDDASIQWDQKLIAWYRSELDKILRGNPYSQNLHINTVKLTTWWGDLLKGDPTVINVIRYGESMIDFGGFFEPLKHLLVQGKIKSTPEAIYSLLQRSPTHITRSRLAALGAVEGLFWSMVDAAHAALISIDVLPPSPEHLAEELKVNFVFNKKLKSKYVDWYVDLLELHKKIDHRKITSVKGIEIDTWQDRAIEFLKVMAKLVDDVISEK